MIILRFPDHYFHDFSFRTFTPPGFRSTFKISPQLEHDLNYYYHVWLRPYHIWLRDHHIRSKDCWLLGMLLVITLVIWWWWKRKDCGKVEDGGQIGRSDVVADDQVQKNRLFRTILKGRPGFPGKEF